MDRGQSDTFGRLPEGKPMFFQKFVKKKIDERRLDGIICVISR